MWIRNRFTKLIFAHAIALFKNQLELFIIYIYLLGGAALLIYFIKIYHILNALIVSFFSQPSAFGTINDNNNKGNNNNFSTIASKSHNCCCYCLHCLCHSVSHSKYKRSKIYSALENIIS